MEPRAGLRIARRAALGAAGCASAAASLLLAGLLLAVGSVAIGCVPAPRPVPAAVEPPVVFSPQLPPCRRIERIEVSRAQRLLRATCEGGGRLELRVALGRDGEAPKSSEGDWRTPQGDYRVSGPPRRSRRYHLFIPIDYPSVADADAALVEGRLSPREYRRILVAHARGETPPADTALGGEIGFHGEGRRWRGDSEHLDWTYGCIAMSDTDIERLAATVEVGTPVAIGP